MDAERHAPIEVESNGVTVEKTFQQTGDGVTRVVFSVASARETAATVELADALPDGVSKSRIGLHPSHGDDHWTVEEDRLTYRDTVAPGEECVTLYGVGTTDPETLDSFHRAPTVDVAGAEDAATVEAATDGGDEAESADPVEALGLSRTPPDDGEGDGERGDGERGDASEDDDSVSDETVDEAADGPAGGREGVPATGRHPEGVVTALATALENGAVDGDEVETLREQLGGVSRSVELRLQDLQSTMHDFEVYRDALGEFIDDNGTAGEVVEEFEARLDQTQEEVADLSADVEAVSERVDAIDERLATVSDRLESVSGVAEANRRFRERVVSSASVDGGDEAARASGPERNGESAAAADED